MNQPDTITSSIPVQLPEPAVTKWDREYRAFLRLHARLLPEYRGKYVAIHEEQVVDSDDALVPLARRVYARHGYIPIYMDLVTDEPRPPVRMPSPRVFSQV